MSLDWILRQVEAKLVGDGSAAAGSIVVLIDACQTAGPGQGLPPNLSGGLDGRLVCVHGIRGHA